MSILNPEKIFRALVSGMGVTPEQIIGAVNSMMAELGAIKTDREGFKGAAAAMVRRYDERLAAIDAKLSAIDGKLDQLLPARNSFALSAPVNGAIAHEEKHDGK